MRQAIVQILNADNSASATGSAFQVKQAVSASFTVINGDLTAAGTLKLQCSNEYTTGTPTEWNDIPNATSSIASGVGSAILVPNMCFAYIRAVYTRSGGGSSTIRVNMNYLSI